MLPIPLLFLYGLLTVEGNAGHVLNTTVCSTELDDSLWKLMNENGSCEPYMGTTKKRNRVSPCDKYFTVGVDNVYIPNSRLEGSQRRLRFFVEEVGVVLGLFPARCIEPLSALACFHFYFPCGTNGTYHVPSFICPEVCSYITETLCPDEWELAKDLMTTQLHPDYRSDSGITVPNCSDPDLLIKFLNINIDCCNTAGISISVPSSVTIAPVGSLDLMVSNSVSTSVAITTETASSSRSTSTVITISVIIIILVLVLSMFLVFGMVFYRKHFIAKKKQQSTSAFSNPYSSSSKGFENQNLYTDEFANVRPSAVNQQFPTSYLAVLSDSMLVKSSIKLLEVVGQGEFGMVFRALLTEEKTVLPTAVAVKTLKGTFNENDLIGIFEETLKMKEFNHYNVLPLIGLFLDENGAPCIVMPYMSEGSLLSYLRKERPHLSIAENASMNEEFVDSVTKQLLSMCLQVANGMEYLSKKKFVHRDLAARNCMMSTDGVIKVADFGLSEDVYMKHYFRLNAETEPQKTQIKLPIKWMALESIHDGLFSEMTDVWSYGVLCWEVFSLGRSPYPGKSPKEVVDFLDSGQRMNKPKNMACTDEIFALITSCWNENPKYRKCFVDIVLTVDELIKPLANYIDFTSHFTQSHRK